MIKKNLYILGYLSPVIVLIGIAILAPIIDPDPNIDHREGQRFVMIIVAVIAVLIGIGYLLTIPKIGKWIEKYIVNKFFREHGWLFPILLLMKLFGSRKTHRYTQKYTIAQLEKMRKIAYIWTKIGAFLIYPWPFLFCGSFTLMMINSKDLPPNLIVIFIISSLYIFPALYVAYRLREKFYLSFQARLPDKTKEYKKYFDKVHYSPSGIMGIGFTMSGFAGGNYSKAAKIIGWGNQDYCTSLITATYKGIKFERCDLKIIETKENYKSIVFDGVWMMIEFHKPINGWINLVGRKKAKTVLKKLKNARVRTENVNFNKKFATYASDTQVALYILTPHYMEAILRLEHEIDSQIIICFFEDVVHLGIYSFENSFEWKLSQKVTENSDKEHFRNQIGVVLRFFDELIDADRIKMINKLKNK